MLGLYANVRRRNSSHIFVRLVNCVTPYGVECRLSYPPPGHSRGKVHGHTMKRFYNHGNIHCRSAPAVEVDKYAKRNDAEAVMSAKERYLARKAAKLANK